MWSERQNRWFLIVAVALLSWVALKIVRPFLEPIFWAAILVVVLQPVHRWILARTRGRRSLAAAIAVTAAVVLLVLPAVVVVLMLGAQAIELYHAAESSLKENTIEEILSRNDSIGGVFSWLRARGYLEPGAMRQRLLGSLQSVSSVVVASTALVLKNVALFVFKAVLAIFTMFYFFRNGEEWLTAAKERLPLGPRRKEIYFGRTRDVIVATMYGSLAIALVQGVLGGFAFAISGIPGPVFWGVMMAFLALLPFGGSALVWGPGAAYLMATGHTGWGIFVLLWGVAVVSTIDNVLRPMIVGGRTRLHPLAVLFSVLGGLQLFGFLGILLGPLVFSLAMVTYQILAADLWGTPMPAEEASPDSSAAAPGTAATAATPPADAP